MAQVDVFIPCYNYGHFLEACVKSVLDQSLGDLRVLIIDDASSDNSLSVAQRLAGADRRVSIISHSKNWGHIRTYNQGIEWASAKYILLLSADDLLLPNALERAVAVMGTNPDVVLTHGKSIVWHDDLPFPQIDSERNYTWVRQNLVSEMCSTAMNPVVTATAVARTSTQKAIGGYRASLPHSADMEMWLRFAAHGAVAHINAVQAVYRKHWSCMSNSYFGVSEYEQRKQAFDNFFDEYGDRLPDPRSLRIRANHALAEQAFRNGVGLLRRGRISGGLEQFRWSIDLDPRLGYFLPQWQLPESASGWIVPIIREATGVLLGASLACKRLVRCLRPQSSSNCPRKH
jgi:glycosyltransferase involved in cell wall biosynthesis